MTFREGGVFQKPDFQKSFQSKVVLENKGEEAFVEEIQVQCFDGTYTC